MGREQSGRGGLPAGMVQDILRLLAREEKLTDQVIAERVGCSDETVRKLRHGIHRSQLGDDRRCNKPERVRLALELLSRDPPMPIARIARLLDMSRESIRAMRDGYYITQRGRGVQPPGGQVNRGRPSQGGADGRTERNS